MPEFQIFIKPVGSACNLNCGYCYYLNTKDLYTRQSDNVMNDQLLEKYTRQHFEASSEKEVFFSWHGGEPLLAGIDFYRKAVRFQGNLKPAGVTVTNGIQTNGILVNRQWAEFLAKENFMVGISLDGPERFHDIYRTAKDGSPTFRKVMQGYELMRKNGIIPEILCVVNSQNVKEPLTVYRFFRNIEAQFITFLPLVKPDPGSESGVTPDSVTADDFGSFLCTIFDEWTEHDIGKIKIQIFEEATRTAFDQEHTLCIFRKDCGGVPVVEHNGDFYSCDHYVNNDHFIANIHEHTLGWCLTSEMQVLFGQYKSASLPAYCRKCEVLKMCNGECPRNRFIKTPGGEAGLNYLCAGYRRFFNHCKPFTDAVRIAWKMSDHKSDSAT